MHHTSPKPHKPQDIQHSPVKTNVNPPTQPSIPDEETQRVPKSTNGRQVKCSKPQPRQQDERLCFYCNQPGHLKRNGPKFPYCPKCRTRGHTPDKCTSKPQRNGHTHETGESRDQWRRNQDLPQFSNRNNRCLHCAGNHQTRDCATTWQWQTLTTNNPASGKVLPHTVTHLTHHFTHLHNLTHSHQPAINTVNPLYMFKHQPSTLTLHIFNPNLQQPPPPLLAQNNQNTNYHTNQQQMHTPPTQPFNTHLPQSFNPQVPPPYF